MAKEKKPEFKMGGFCKYVLKKWPILLCCLIIGVCISAYSWKHQNLAYDAQTTLLLHDKVDTAGDNDEYAQIVNILSSKEAYAKIGVDVEDVDFDNIKVTGITTGIVKIEATGNSEEEAQQSVDFIVKNSEKVIDSIFKENDFETVVLEKPSESSVSGTKKDKILSVTVIMFAMVLLAITADFITFNKKTN